MANVTCFYKRSQPPLDRQVFCVHSLIISTWSNKPESVSLDLKSAESQACNLHNAYRYTHHAYCVYTVLPRCYAPPLLRPTFRKKRGGGGVTTRTCAFASQLSPPPSHEIRVLCSAVEDENSFDRHAVAVLKDGRVVGHVHVAKHSR